MDVHVACLQSAIARPQAVGMAAIGMKTASQVDIIRLEGQEFAIGPGAWHWGSLLSGRDYSALASLKRRALALATLATDEEILAGESIAAFLPADAINLIGAVIFSILVGLFTHNTLNYFFFPNWDLVIIVLLLGPLAFLLAVGYSVLISSKLNDVRAAQQLGALILLPFAGIYVLSETRVLELTTNNLLIMGAILVAVDVIVFFLAKATFQRNEILTQWK